MHEEGAPRPLSGASRTRKARTSRIPYSARNRDPIELDILSILPFLYIPQAMSRLHPMPSSKTSRRPKKIKFINSRPSARPLSGSRQNSTMVSLSCSFQTPIRTPLVPPSRVCITPLLHPCRGEENVEVERMPAVQESRMLTVMLFCRPSLRAAAARARYASSLSYPCCSH